MAAAMRCSPTGSGWDLDFLSSAGNLAHDAGESFANYISSAPPDFTLWDPTNIAPSLRNSVQLIDNRFFADVDVVKRVYRPLGLDRLAHATVLASTGPRFLGWIGVWREAPFGAAELQQISQATPAIRERLMAIDELGSAEVSWSIVESALEAMEQPAFLVRGPLRVELANGAGLKLLKTSRRSVLALIERALRDETDEWSVHRFADVGVPQLALVSQRPAGATFERRVEQARHSWMLSAAHVSVLRFLVRGFSNKEIASALKRAPGTIELHVSAILKKANVDSRARLQARFWE